MCPGWTLKNMARLRGVDPPTSGSETKVQSNKSAAFSCFRRVRYSRVVPYLCLGHFHSAIVESYGLRWGCRTMLIAVPKATVIPTPGRRLSPRGIAGRSHFTPNCHTRDRFQHKKACLLLYGARLMNYDGHRYGFRPIC